MRWMTFGAIGSAILWAGQTGATELIATYTGTVGAVQSSSTGIAEGDPFTASFVYDPAAGILGGVTSVIYIGTSYSTLIAAFINVDSQTFSVDHGYIVGEIDAYGTSADGAGLTDTGDESLSATVNQASATTYLTQPFSAIGSSGFGVAYFETKTLDLNAYLNSTAVTLSVTTKTFPALTDGVPEPATWAMLLLGFGALGMLRRRQGAAMSVIEGQTS